MPTMRAYKIILIGTFLCAWFWILYLLSRYHPSVDTQHRYTYQGIDAQLQLLEQDVRDEMHNNRDLLVRLTYVVRELNKMKAQQQTNDIPPANADRAYSAPNVKTPPSSARPAHKSRIGTPVRHSEPSVQPNNGPVIPVLVFACNRVSVAKCLDQLIAYRPNAYNFPIIVSQDCDDADTRAVIQSYANVTLIRQPDQSDIVLPPKERKFKGYYKIARHYGWALNETFRRGYDSVIVVEDDLNVAPDIFEYFLGTNELLHADPTLWCVSAWNDNGKAQNIDVTDASLLYRSDFFPGLGWMLTRKLWTELASKWPMAFWDDWIREPKQRKNRACIRPEISRTSTFGKIGVSNGMFYEKHLRHIWLSEHYVEFSKLNLSYLMQEPYDREFMANVYRAPLVTFDELRRGLVDTNGSVRIQYTSRDQYKRLTKQLGLMDDFKSGVPRTGYRGIVSLFHANRRVFLAPKAHWSAYDPAWS